LARARLVGRCTGALTMEAPRMRVRCATIVRRRLSMS
jgi:hypothetical protein